MEKYIYRITIDGKTYSFTSKENASLLLRIPKSFDIATDFVKKKYHIDNVEIYNFQTLEQVENNNMKCYCEFCKRIQITSKEARYCCFCGSLLWKKLKSSVIEQQLLRKQGK